MGGTVGAGYVGIEVSTLFVLLRVGMSELTDSEVDDVDRAGIDVVPDVVPDVVDSSLVVAAAVVVVEVSSEAEVVTAAAVVVSSAAAVVVS